MIHSQPQNLPAPKVSAVSAEVGLVFMALIWGLNFAVLKVTFREIDPLPFNAVRFLMASLVLWLLVHRAAGSRLPDRGDWMRVFLLGVVGNVVYQLFFILGIDLTLAGNASILLASTPVWTTLLSTAVGHERPPLLLWIGVAGTVGGMVLVVLGGGGEVGLGGANIKGDLMIAGASFSWSVYTVGSRNLVGKYGALSVTAWTLWVGAIGIFLLGVPGILATDWRAVSLGGWAGVLYAGILAVAVAYLLWYRGVQRLGNARTAAYSNLIPIVALIAAWVWLQETPTATQLGGAAAVLGGLYLSRRTRTPLPDPPEPE